MKKLVAVMLSVLMIGATMGTLAGCGGSKPGEITVLINRTDLKNTVLKDAKSQFDEKFKDKGWTVNFETISDYEGDTTIRMSGRAYGDVLLIPDSVLTTELEYYFMPLGKVSDMEKDWRFISNKAYNGTVYGLPTYGSTSGVLYNKKVFSDAGITTVPSTPEEFLDAMAKIKTANASNSKFVPYYTNFSADWPLNQWTEAISVVSGNANYDNDVYPWDKGAFDEGGTQYTVYKLLYDLVKGGYTEKDPTTTEWERSKVELVNGNIGAMVLGSWAIPQFQQVATGIIPGEVTDVNASDIIGKVEDIGYMPFPYKAADGKSYAMLKSDFAIGIASNTKNKEAAEAFLYWFLDDFKYYKVVEGVPGRKSETDLPDVISAFEDLGVTFIESTEAKVPEARPYAEEESLITLWAENWKKPFVEEAIKSNGKSYASICSDLSATWRKTVDKVIEKFGNQPA